MGSLKPIFGNFDENGTRRKQTSDRIQKYKLFREIFIYYYVPSFEIQADIFMSLESI